MHATFDEIWFPQPNLNTPCSYRRLALRASDTTLRPLARSAGFIPAS